MKDKYVFYDVDGERFSVRESEMSEFEKDFPNAIINMSVDGENFPVKLSEREDFLNDFGDGASYTNFDEQEKPEIKSNADEIIQKPKRDSLNNILTSVNDSLMRAQLGANKTFADQQAEQMTAPAPEIDRDMANLVIESHRGNKARVDEYLAEQDKTGYDYDPTKMAGSIPMPAIGLANNMYLQSKKAQKTKGQDYTDALIAQRLQGKVEDKVEQHLDPSKTFLTGAAEGFKDTAFDLDIWDSGMAAEDAARVYAISKKLDNGDELTEGEDMIIEALVDDLASDIYLAAGFGRGYKAGQVTGESLPFMVETMLNPASKFGESITKKFGKEIFKRVGRKLGVKAARAAVHGTRVLSDMAGAAMMSATTSQARVAEDALNRLSGQVDFEINDDGTLGFKGFVGGEDSALKAYAKAYGSNAIEHFSEMVGNYFGPLGEMAKDGTATLANKVGLKKVGELLTEMTPNGFGSLVNDFAEQTQWHGMIGEFAEEMVSGAMNALVVGDQTLKKYDEDGNLNENYLFDKDNMIDTFLGVAILGGVMSTAKTLGYTTPETRYNREISKAKKALDGKLTENEINQLEAFASNPMGMDYANLRPFFEEGRSDESKKAVATYLKAVMEKQGYNISRQADLSGTQQGINEMRTAWTLGQNMTEADLYDVDEALNQAVTEANNAGLAFTLEDVSQRFSYDLFNLSQHSDYTPEERAAVRNLAIIKNAQEGLNNKLDAVAQTAVAINNEIANNAAKDGVLTFGVLPDGRRVFVKGDVKTENGRIATPDFVSSYPVEIVDAATGETATIESNSIQNVVTQDVVSYNALASNVITASYEQRKEQWRNTKSIKSKLAEIQNFVGEKVYIKTANNDMAEVEVQQILPNGEVLIKGKKGDLGGQSTIRVDVDSFYDSMSRDANGNPIFNQSEFRSQTQGIADAQNRMYVQGQKARDARKPSQQAQTNTSEQPTEQDTPEVETPQEQTPEAEVPQTPVETDFRDFTDIIIINGKPIKVDEVTAQDDISDSITYRYTDENGVQRTGNSTIGAFAEAVNLARQQTETPAPEPTAVGETTVPPTEQTIETPAPETAPTEQTEQTPVDWETMLDFEPENYLAEMQNRYGDKTIKMLNAVLSATQRQLDKLNKATPEAHEEILQNEVKKDILQARIDKLGEMVARLSIPVTPEAPAETAPVAETPVGEEPAPSPEIPAKPVEEPTPAPVAETPEVPTESTPVPDVPVVETPVAPNPVANPIDEARKKERQLATNLKKIGLSPEHKQDLAYNAGKAIADMFATREEYDAYAESATDFGQYNADFERGVDDSFAARNQQNTGNTPVNSVPLENEPNGENNGTEGAAANEDVQGRGSDNGSTGTDNGRGEEGVPQVSEEQPTHEGEAGADEALEEKYPARKGDAKQSDFVDVFGFKGVDATLPQHILNSTYDMLMEIAKMLGISPKSITHGGTLELGVVPNSEPDSVSAVYAANGRYGTPVTKAIMELRDGKNLSAIAHEWWHSLDHVLRYWNSGRGRESASNATAENFDGRPEVLKAIKGVLSAIRKSGHVDRIKGLNFSSSHIDYLKSKKELGARAFEEYIIGKLAEAGIEIEGIQKDDWVAQPTAEEMAIIAPAFDNLFKILQEKEGKTPGTSVLFHIGQEADERINNLVSEEATDLTNEVIDISLEGANIDVERPSDEQAKEVLALGGLENEYSIGGNNPIFISNAALAVQQIKQEKATPEQWLKMIEKAGGLKAGEDKWMGLSDWLKASDKKTLTKQEVLDFINENTIRIEEVNYVAQIELEEEEQKQLDAMNEEFLALREQAQDAGEWIADAGEIAYQLMADKYGDDFTIGFGVDNGELYVSNLEAAASITGIEPRSEREINDTRLRYTTEGLDNKKEIAIIIPTIDKWNQYDEIHFGDAGDGRTVAWVRFGDAKKLVSTTETIVIEEFEKPFKNYKGWDVYKPLGRKDDHMYISAGTLKDGRFVYGVFVKDTAIGAYESFDEAKDALNKYLAENPSKRFVNKRVLVIDEIQSKRHQEGREKGYRTTFSEETEEIKNLKGDLENLVGMRNSIMEEIAREPENEDSELARIDILLDSVENISQYDLLNKERDNITKRKEGRRSTLSEIEGQIDTLDYLIHLKEEELKDEMFESNLGKIPDAPFDKNWHELAMKRMLRYAAENGYDAVAWTKGEQQAERYSLTKYFNGIAREDNPSVAGKRFQLYGGNVETIVVNDAGVVTDSTIDEAKGKSLSDVVGKEVADKMMTIEDGDSLGDADIAIGGEGMKGFYDKMLPTFINKYGKKWGVKAEEIKLNGLEDGEVYMHSVPVNEAMKNSVMEGQPMFFKTPKGIVYGWTDGKKIYLTKAGMNPNTKIHEYTHIWSKAMMQKNPKGWNSIKQLLKNTPIWNEVINDANYSNIHGNEDAIASEALSRISGTENAAKLEQMAQQMIDEAKGTMRKAEARGLIQNMKDALTKFWNWVGTNLFGIENFKNIDEVTDRILYDLLNKTDLGELREGETELQIAGEKGAYNLDVEEELGEGVAYRMNALELAEQLESEGFDKKQIRTATGWERGYDGKWRYEIDDLVIKDNIKLKKGMTLGDIAEKNELFKAYPFLADIEVRKMTTKEIMETDADGAYIEDDNTIIVRIKNDDGIIGIDEWEVLVHEVQHAIQHYEGFTTGASESFVRRNAREILREEEKKAKPLYDRMEERRGQIADEMREEVYAQLPKRMSKRDKENALSEAVDKAKFRDEAFESIRKQWLPYAKRIQTLKILTGNLFYLNRLEDPMVIWDLYKSYAGEVEARNAVNRMYLSDYERAEKNLEETEGTPRELQIAIGEASAVAEDRKNSDGLIFRNSDSPITPEMDAEYLVAVEAGDMETAQRMVLEAAKLAMPNTKVVDENGNPIVMYHGSPNKFTTFDIDKFGRTDLGSFGKGFYFTSVESRAKRYGENVVRVFLNVENPINAKENEVLSFVFGSKDKKDVLDRIFDPNDNAMSQEEKEIAATMVNDDIVNESKNYDGVDASTVSTAFAEVVVRDPSQIKSADPVTYDDAGNVIPLSERFNPENKDIRYRKSDIQNAAVDYLAGPQRNEVIQRAVNEEAAKLGVSVTYVTREQMPKGHKSDKGYFNTETGEIVICTENAASIADAIQTILHEAVAHKGLRQLMGDKFNEFINRVYDSLDAETKAKVDALAESKYNGNTAVAMEEYMASLAETENFAENSVWDKIKSAFENIINAILGRNDIKIGDNELRYILRASYNNMVNPRNMESIRGWARDQMMREDYKINHVAPELLSRTGIDPTQVATQTASLVYDQVVSDSWQEFQRQFQDAMQPVRIAIDAIQQETGNVPIEDYENYILIQNQSSSRSRVEIDDFARRYYSPIIEQVNKVIDTILESRGYDKNDREKRAEVYNEVKTYIIAKHGLERNAYYQTRNTRKITAKTKAERIKSVREDHKDTVDQINNDPTLSPSEKANLIRQEKKRRDTLINQIRDTDYELDVRDYSGLTALFGFRPEQYLEAEAEAERCVEQFENAVATDELWAKIKSATDKTLRHSYESGLLSRQQYNDIKNMFEFYIPLRGFDESTAEDVYAYARFEGNRFNPAVQKAEGRTSLADDPIAIIMNMAESEIAQGNKNRAKQALYNYLLNRSDGLEKQNSLMQIESVWAIKTIDAFGNEVYVIASPDHAAGETLEEFEERMQVMAEAGLAKKSQKGHVDVGMRFQKPSNKDAHYVYLKVNGVEKAIYINGNPKAADAINGTYAPMPSEFMQKVKDVQRLVSSTFTNYSLEFTARNYFRDMVYSHINIGVRESDPAYRKKFRQNWRHNNMGAMLKMLTAYRAGELDGRPLTADEAAFVEFMNNGGQTGYTLINSVETHKKELERAIERMQKGIVKGGVKDTTIFRYTLGGIELLNEASELVTRFAAFKTSRDMGRGINRSISDAKEVTVNFNTKGAQDGTGWMGVVARYLGAVKYFFNASVQGVQNLGEAFQKNKLKFGTVVGSTIGLGMMMPILQGALSELIGGDEDEYWNIPEYDRQNNLCFVIGKGKYVKLPLPIGFREMYGLGDLMMAGLLDKKFARSPLSVGMDVANKIATVVLPINPLEGSANGLSLIESGQDMLLPDFTQGMVQNRTNTDFKGVPIQKEYTYNENDPQWTKAFANNPSLLTGLSKWCYEHLEIDGEGWDWSPEKLDNTFSNAFGGIYSLLKKTGRTVSAIWNEDNRTLSNVPLVGVIVGSNIDDDQRFVNSTYWEMDEYYNKRLYKIKSTAANFGLTLDDVFARNPEGERAGEHHPAMNKIYNKSYFDFMQEWYLGHKGEGETDENGEKILGLSQIKNKITNLENKIKKNEDGVATPEQDEELVELNNSYEAARRDLVNDLLELD